MATLSGQITYNDGTSAITASWTDALTSDQRRVEQYRQGLLLVNVTAITATEFDLAIETAWQDSASDYVEIGSLVGINATGQYLIQMPVFSKYNRVRVIPTGGNVTASIVGTYKD